MVTQLGFVAEFWWKLLCVFVGERDKKVARKERQEKTKFFILFVGIVYYFNELCKNRNSNVR